MKSKSKVHNFQGLDIVIVLRYYKVKAVSIKYAAKTNDFSQALNRKEILCVKRARVSFGDVFSHFCPSLAKHIEAFPCGLGFFFKNTKTMQQQPHNFALHKTAAMSTDNTSQSVLSEKITDLHVLLLEGN